MEQQILRTLRYRWNVVGHEKQLIELEQDVAETNVSHAYLFAGAEKIGKFTIARKLAQILQCEKDFCGICSICQHILKGYHFDTIEIADNGESIKIDDVREALNKLYLSPQGKFRILLIKNIERMTIESANALLKTLEDPPERVKFLLTTSNIKELPATVLSRVRLYKLNSLAEDQLSVFLKNSFPQISESDLKTAMALAGGKPGKALFLLQDADLLNHYKNMYNQLSVFLKENDRTAQFAYVAEISKEDALVKDFLEVFLAVIRYHLLQDFTEGSNFPEASRKIELIKCIQQTQEMMKRNVNTRLALENIMLAL
jgi:DNA polymerase III gamma/tau subunit